MENVQSTREQILLMLRKHGKLSMDEIANNLGITKMAVYKHLSRLENDRIVTRSIDKRRVGRPVSLFLLTENGKERFRSSYAAMIRSMISYLVEKGERELVVDFLKKRYEEIGRTYRERLAGLSFEKKVGELTRIRDEEGYVAEHRKTPGSAYELREFNCPIYEIAQILGEACWIEGSLFKSVLDTKVDLTHRQAAGDSYCRFMIRVPQ